MGDEKLPRIVKYKSVNIVCGKPHIAEIIGIKISDCSDEMVFGPSLIIKYNKMLEDLDSLYYSSYKTSKYTWDNESKITEKDVYLLYNRADGVTKELILNLSTNL